METPLTSHPTPREYVVFPHSIYISPFNPDIACAVVQSARECFV